jgi:hypothetical protein
MLNAYRHPYLRQGVFFDEDAFRMSNYLAQWGSRMLNDDAEIAPIAEFIDRNIDSSKEIFVRPDEDSKSFTGSATTFGEFREIARRVIGHHPHITGSTMIAVASPKRIEKEWRNIVVGNSIVSSALYRNNGRTEIGTADIPEEMIRFAYECFHTYMQPDSMTLILQRSWPKLTFASGTMNKDSESSIISCNLII